MLPAAGTEPCSRHLSCYISTVLEIRQREELSQRLVPDYTSLFPREAAKGPGQEVERVVWNAGVDMNSTPIAVISIRQIDEIVHVLRLRVAAEVWIVFVRGAGIFQRAERDASDSRGDDVIADEPVGLVHILFWITRILLH